jgi:hypothetical protein
MLKNWRLRYTKTNNRFGVRSSEFRNQCVYVIVLLMLGLGTAMAQTDPLKSGFDNPPASARPRVWWHWMNGNITKDGIKLDEEWMHRAGLGGFQNFDASCSLRNWSTCASST